MSLKSLFSITLAGLLFVILVTIFSLTIRSTQDFIENQLYSSSQDTVYTLGMSIATLDLNRTSDDVELIINAIFDSGYYEYIKFYDTELSLIYEAKLPVVVKDVPSWFIDIVPIEVNEANGVVNSGWQHIGSLSIKGHIGYAYYELWKAFNELLIVFSFIALISFIILFLVINTLLFSLKRIKEQAEAINEHKFIVQNGAPFIKEFDVLIKTMNKMVKKVEGIFQSEAETFEHYQSLLYRDEETRLANKKYFILKLKELMDENNDIHCYIAIASIDGLNNIKKTQGYDQYKKVLMSLSKNILNNTDANNLVARIGENEFAVLFNTNDTTKTIDDFKSLQDSLNISNKHLKSHEQLFNFNIGIAPYFEDDNISQVLSRVDYALSRSKTIGYNTMDMYKEQKEQCIITLGKNKWHEIFSSIFEENRIVLAEQSVKNKNDDSIFHHEIFIRIREHNNTFQTASYYLPIANSLGLSTKIDQHVIKMITNNMQNITSAYAINISKEFIKHSHSFLELRNILSSLQKSHPYMLHFECSESDILQDIETQVKFTDMVHALKQCYGIDRFSGLNGIAYIKKLRPDYIKINVNYILEAHKDNQIVLQTLKILAQTMDITLIITAIQNKEQLEKLKEIGYEYFQGQFIEEPMVKD